MPGENKVEVVVTRINQVQTTGGGFTDDPPTTIYSGDARFFPAVLRSSEDRDEADPGISTASYRYFKLDKPVSFVGGATEFLAQDRIALDGVTYILHNVWDYKKSVQIEAERIH
jgi:hypothetical protein